jgi:hypothetical protein
LNSFPSIFIASDIAALVASLEDATAQAADKKLRSETSAAIEAIADEVERAGAAFDAGAAVLAETTGRAAAIIYDATGLQVFTANVRSEVPAAIKMIASILRDRAHATISGTAPASLPKVALAPKPVQLPPPAIETVFFLRAAKWTDVEGKLHLIPKFGDGELPPEIAARALALGAAVPIDDPRRRQFGCQSLPLPNVEWCTNLDNSDAAPNTAEPVIHSAFEKLDRGPAYTIKAPREATP